MFEILVLEKRSPTLDKTNSGVTGVAGIWKLTE
jgi:hypothetical protein